jgi:flagellar hook protein FlgE
MSFQQGLAGLNAASKSLEVIGNNVANSGTFGAKSSRAEFASVYAAAANGMTTGNIGIGVEITGISQQFSQGNITTTDNSMDVALNGAGFFEMLDPNGQTYYTRNGQFKVDRDGYIVNNQKQQLLGYPANALGVIVPGPATPIQLPTAGIAPKLTDTAAIEMNLDARDEVTAPATPGIEYDDPSTYNNATSVTAYDAQGKEVALSFYFQKSGVDAWNVYVTADGAPVQVDGADFAPVTFPASGGTPLTPAAALNLTTAAGDVAFDLSGATQYGSTFGVTSFTQNGYAPGQLTGIAIESDGLVTARYSNGQSTSAGQVELANFRNVQGLQPQGGNAWASTFASGDPVVGAPGQGNFGVLQSGALEESNIDVTAELVNMITVQRFYQANAQSIKTQDSVSQTLLNLR